MHLIRAAYDALPPGGAFVVVENLIDDARRENAFGLMMSLNMLIEFGDAFDFTGGQAPGRRRRRVAPPEQQRPQRHSAKRSATSSTSRPARHALARRRAGATTAWHRVHLDLEGCPERLRSCGRSSAGSTGRNARDHPCRPGRPRSAARGRSGRRGSAPGRRCRRRYTCSRLRLDRVEPDGRDRGPVPGERHRQLQLDALRLPDEVENLLQFLRREALGGGRGGSSCRRGRHVRTIQAREPGPADGSDYQGSVRLVKARPLSAAGLSPPVQIITPSFN